MVIILGLVVVWFIFHWFARAQRDLLTAQQAVLESIHAKKLNQAVAFAGDSAVELMRHDANEMIEAFKKKHHIEDDEFGVPEDELKKKRLEIETFMKKINEANALTQKAKKA